MQILTCIAPDISYTGSKLKIDVIVSYKLQRITVLMLSIQYTVGCCC